MAFGMRCKNSAGEVYLDETDRLPALVDSFAYSFAAGAKTTTVAVAGVSATTHFAYATAGDPVLCLVQAGSVKLTRIRASYSGVESGQFILFRM